MLMRSFHTQGTRSNPFSGAKQYREEKPPAGGKPSEDEGPTHGDRQHQPRGIRLLQPQQNSVQYGGKRSLERIFFKPSC